MKLVVGLGNPGKRYEKTRHNVGFMILDGLRNRLVEEGCEINEWELSKKFNAELSGCQIKDEKIILAKPMTFMNASGQTVQLIAHYYKIPVRDIIVIHDDKDLNLGVVKVQSDRGHAGHNGVRSIVDHIGSQKFNRVRVGIASQNDRKMQDISKFVLKKFGLLERKVVEKTIIEATNKLLKLINK